MSVVYSVTAPDGRAVVPETEAEFVVRSAPFAGRVCHLASINVGTLPNRDVSMRCVPVRYECTL